MHIPEWFCHQRPDRSIFIRGRRLPLCARCFPFYLFILVGFLFNLVFGISPDLFSVRQALILLLLFTIPMGVDGVTQQLQLRESTNTIRFITGMLPGFWTGVAIHVTIQQIYLKMMAA